MTPKRVMANILRTAARNIEMFGWRKGVYGNESTGYCALGALMAQSGSAYWSGPVDDTHSVLLRRVREYTGEPVTVYMWNDKLARDSAEVTGLLRKLARDLDHGLKVEA